MDGLIWEGGMVPQLALRLDPNPHSQPSCLELHYDFAGAVPRSPVGTARAILGVRGMFFPYTKLHHVQFQTCARYGAGQLDC